MINVRPGYPEELSAIEIKAEIEKLRIYSNGNGFNPDLIIAANLIISSGLVELNDRFTKRTFWSMFFLTVMSLIAAGMSIYYVYKTDRSDAEWRVDEINVLKQIQNTVYNSVNKGVGQ